MSKEKACRVLEFRTGSGELLFSVWLNEKGMAFPETPKPEEKPAQEKGGDSKKDEGKKEPVSSANILSLSRPKVIKSRSALSSKRYLTWRTPYLS